ncbi:MAG: hypothetical protein E6F96_08665 [Actinobacteria bacterium]|nr:MAG: hypothetical protein E6F96_08665 [Actinomycetota bacterium]
MSAKGASPIFPRAPVRAGMYESFYLRAVAPDEPLGAWIRHTVHKRPGQRPRGSVWCTLFDASQGPPLMHKLTTDGLQVPAGGWIAVTDAGAGGGTPEAREEGAWMAPGRAQGRCGPASWNLSWSSQEPELRHLGRELLYRSPVPRTKLTSPTPRASFSGTIEVEGRNPIEVRNWPGMVGHNWGSEHAERWIWLHALGFAQAPETWLDVALGRVKLAGVLSPWVANGALSLGGRRHRLGGLGARGVRVQETVAGCVLRVAGERGLALEAHVSVPSGTAAGWRYADPDGGGHDVVNCSVAAVELEIRLPGEAAARTLSSAHGGAYELGMRERDHGVPIAPFPDG